MGTNSPFLNLFNNFLQAVQDADKSLEVASHFGPTKSTESMFEYFWGIEEAHQCLNFNIIESFKSQSQADQLRMEGNIYYQRGQLEQALDLYNMCISFAPVPLINDNVNEMSIAGHENGIKEQQKSTSLAYGFANRSAVLFELEQYEKSINDIDWALTYGYPIEQIFKLIERKAKCLIELQKHQDAKALLSCTIHLLSTMNMDEPKKRTKRNKLLSLLNKLQQGKTKSEYYEDHIPNGVNPITILINKKSNNTDNKEDKDYNIPRLYSQHATILSVSSSLRLQYTTEQGRFFVADRDIKPGELILVEKSPYSCLHLKREILCSHCCVCLMKCNNPLPCHNCTMVMFCSEACQSKRFNGHTDVECLTLQTLESLSVGNYCPLAFKVITQIPYKKLKRLIPDSKMQLTESSLTRYGFNRNGKFDSSDFLSTFALIDNISQQDCDELFKKVAISFILTKLLIKSNHYFIDETGLSFRPSDEDILLIGSTFVSLIMSFHCNAHSVEEFQATNYDVQKISGVGAAVFPAQSLLNHSCNPDTFRSTIGSHMTSYAIRLIPKGSEVTDSYGCHYVVHDTQYRQAELKKKYCFECKCEACIGKWTISEIQSSIPKFKILNNTSVNEHIEQEEEYKIKYKQLRNSFQKVYFNIIKGDVSMESKNALIDFIEFLDMYVIFPCKMYHDVQGLLKFCIDTESSSKHLCK